MNRSDFFRGMWLSPLALVRGPETPENSASTVEAKMEAALAQLAATNMEVFNVRSHGAVGNGTADDTPAIRDAIAAAKAANTVQGSADGSIVFFPAGVYGITSDLDLPIGITLLGVGNRATYLKWIGSRGGTTTAVVTSNLNGEEGNGFNHGTRIRDLTIDAERENYGAYLRGWNEDCVLEFARIRNADVACLVMEAVSQPANFVMQHTAIRHLRVGNCNAGSTGIILRDVRRVIFDNITVDQPASQNGAMAVGIELQEGCNQNIFTALNIEDCDIGIDQGTLGVCAGNIFTNVMFANSNHGAADISVGSFTGKHCFVNRSRGASKSYTFLSARDFHGHDWVITDDVQGKGIPGTADQAGADSGRVTSVPFLFVCERSGGQVGWLDKNEHWVNSVVIGVKSATLGMGDNNNFDAEARDTLRLSANAAGSTLTGIAGGVGGRRIRILNISNTLTVADEDAGSSEANRFTIPTGIDRDIPGGAAIDVEYDATTARWRVLRGGRVTSGYAPSNVTTERRYDANSTSLDQVADVLGTLIADLQSLRIIK